MKQKPHKIPQEVEKTLDLLENDNVIDVKVNPFFYTKLSVHINYISNSGSLINSFYDLFKKAYLIPAAMVFLMFFNIVTFYYVKDSSSETGSTLSDENNVESFIETYELKGN